MKNIPELSEYTVSKESNEEFNGIDHNERTQSGSWYDLENMTLDDYPVASTRNERGIVQEFDEDEITYSTEDGATVSVGKKALDACSVGDELVLLRSATLGDTSGNLLTDGNNNITSIRKKEYTLEDCKYNDLWREFEEKYMNSYRTLCTLSGRVYTAQYWDNAFRMCAIVTTTNDAGNGVTWTFPLLISSEDKTLVYYSYHASNSNSKTLCTFSTTYTDSRGKVWYCSGNNNAMPGEIESTEGSLISIGSFETVEKAIERLIEIYYEHFYDLAETEDNYNYSPLLDYPCNKEDDEELWRSIFDDVDTTLYSSNQKVYIRYKRTVGSYEGERLSYMFEKIDNYLPEKYNIYSFGANITESSLEALLEAGGYAIDEAVTEQRNYNLTLYFMAMNTATIANGCIMSLNSMAQIQSVLSELQTFDDITIMKGGIYKITIYRRYYTASNTYEYFYLKVEKYSSTYTARFYVTNTNKYYQTDKATGGLGEFLLESLNQVAWKLNDDGNLILRNADESDTQGIISSDTDIWLAKTGESEYEDDVTVKATRGETYIFGEGDETEEISVHLTERQDINNEYSYAISKSVNPTWIYNAQKGNTHTEDLDITSQSEVADEEEFKETIALFDSSTSDKSIVKSGSKLLVLPDGVLVDTETGESVKVNNEQNITVDTNEDGYKVYTTYDGEKIETVEIYDSANESAAQTAGYRYVENIGVQKYVNASGFEWSSVTTGVRVYTGDTNYAQYYNVGDVVKVSINDYSGIEYNVGFFSSDEQYLKIGAIGTENGNGYIDFESTYAVGDMSNVSFTLEISRDFPNANLGCESQNRIWLTQKEGHEIYASALGDPLNYYDYSGLNSDSFAVNVGTDGEFTGAVNYLGTPLFFKENCLHIISGSLPSEYYVTTITEFMGCESGSSKSFAIINSILYYRSPFGIVAYDGDTTTVISADLGKDVWKNAVGGALGNKYYVSMYNNVKQERELYCYDTTKAMWTRESDKGAVRFVTMKNSLMYVHNRGIEEISNVEFDEGEATEGEFDWFVETGTYGYSYPNQKYISRFQIRMKLSDGARANFYIQYNSDGVWLPCGAQLKGNGTRSFLFPIRPQRCDHMKLKIEGTGQAKIYSITKLLEEGGDIV